MPLGEHHVEKIILAEPRGFCAGVDRAVEAVRSALRTYGRPLYVRHQIVHNRFVLEALVEEGAIFVEDLAEVPEGQRVIFSAHGVAPSEWDHARARNLRVIDATCPLVTKVHSEVERYAGVVLIAPRTIPKTSSGKVQRWLCRREYLVGHLNEVARWQSPARSETASVPAHRSQ